MLVGTSFPGADVCVGVKTWDETAQRYHVIKITMADAMQASAVRFGLDTGLSSTWTEGCAHVPGVVTKEDVERGICAHVPDAEDVHDMDVSLVLEAYD